MSKKTPLNIEKLRADTPGCSEVIHFNNAGASLMPRPVVESVTEYLREEALYGGYETAEDREDELSDVYSTIADFLHADKEEIAILENATAAWNMAFYSIPFSRGDRILTSVSEYASNFLNYLNLQKRVDVEIEVIPNDKHGQTSVEALSQMMGSKVKLISITHIPTNSGLVNPAEEIGKIAGEHNCLYLLDVCQSAGQYPLDVTKIGCDMLSATGRKYLRGPRGTGFLYVSQQVLDQLHPLFLDLHSSEWTGEDSYTIREDARRFENWESNYAGIIGLNQAVNYAMELGMEQIWDRISYLGQKMRKELETLDTVTVRDIGQVQGGIVTFSLDSVTATEVKTYLRQYDINVSVSTKSSTLIDMERRNLEEVVRASVHYYNTEEEIFLLVDLLDRM